MAKRGDPLAKAWAGSLSAAHDEEITIVGDFNIPHLEKVHSSVVEMVNHGALLPFKTITFLTKNGRLGTACRKGFISFHGKRARLLRFSTSSSRRMVRNVLERSRFEFIKNEDGWCTKILPKMNLYLTYA